MMNAIPKYVASKTAAQDGVGKFEVAGSDVAKAVAKLKGEAGKDTMSLAAAISSKRSCATL